jgi:hypothetical protein
MRNKDVKRRLTGFSASVLGFGVGAEWEPTEAATGVARKVLSFLADRRVLFNPYFQEEAGECVASVVEVRRMLTDEIGALHEDKVLVPHLDAMRAACRRFLDQVRSVTNDDHHRGLWVANRQLNDVVAYRELHDLVMALGDFRTAMGIQIGLIASTFGLDVPDTIVDILPPPPDDGTEVPVNL